MAHPFGDWTPDLPSWSSPHLRDAKNVTPNAEGYEPLRTLQANTGALGARCRGSVSTRDEAATVHVYAGDATKLYELASDTTWTDRSKAGGYTASETTRWQFAVWKELILATNNTQAIQSMDMSSGSAFADLGGSPPLARYIAPFGEFVMLGNTADSAMQIRWSAISDATSWTVGTNQADRVTFPDGGVITGLGYSDVMYVFQEFAIRRVSYVGPPTVMNIDVIERGRGPIDGGSIAQVGSRFFYLAEDGFYVFDGAGSTPIGFDKIDDWFLDDFNRAYAYRMSATSDPRKKLVVWLYTSKASPDGTPDTLLFFNYASGRWSYARVSAQTLVRSLGSGVTLEGLDALYPGGIDTMTVSLDDPVWQGGTLSLAAFTTDHKRGGFSGSFMEATLETSDMSGSGRSLLRSAYPLTDASGTTVAIGYRERPGDSFTYTTPASQQASGRVPVRASGRQFRARMVVPAAATWTHAMGVTLTGEAAGMR